MRQQGNQSSQDRKPVISTCHKISVEIGCYLKMGAFPSGSHYVKQTTYIADFLEENIYAI